MIIQNAPAGQALYAEYYIDNVWVSVAENSESTKNHAYYQGYFNADGSMDYVFNINRPNVDLDEQLMIRIYSGD